MTNVLFSELLLFDYNKRIITTGSLIISIDIAQILDLLQAWIIRKVCSLPFEAL